MYTLVEAEENYALSQTAYKNALTNKGYTVGSNTKTNQALQDLKTEMNYWKNLVTNLSNGKTKRATKRIIPR